MSDLKITTAQKRKLSIIWLGLMGSGVVFLSVILMLAYREKPDDILAWRGYSSITALHLDYLIAFFWVLSIFFYPFSLFFVKRLNRISLPGNEFHHVLRSMALGCQICDVPTVLGLVTVLMGGHMFHFLGMLCLSFYFKFRFRPEAVYELRLKNRNF